MIVEAVLLAFDRLLPGRDRRIAPSSSGGPPQIRDGHSCSGLFLSTSVEEKYGLREIRRRAVTNCIRHRGPGEIHDIFHGLTYGKKRSHIGGSDRRGGTDLFGLLQMRLLSLKADFFPIGQLYGFAVARDFTAAFLHQDFVLIGLGIVVWTCAAESGANDAVAPATMT